MLAMFAACALSPLVGRTAQGGRYAQRAFADDPLSVSHDTPVRLVAARRDPFVAQFVDLPSGATVHVLILGDRPRALVQIGGTSLIVGVGDVVEGMRVVAINEGGVWLADGAHIAVAPR